MIDEEIKLYIRKSEAEKFYHGEYKTNRLKEPPTYGNHQDRALARSLQRSKLERKSK